jgi:hypothetical protein
MFTADTGAARTVISTKAFKQIPRDKQPQLKKSCTLAGADGQPLVELGKAMFSINLGQLTMERELGICLKAFVEITVLAAPVSAVNIILLPCTAPSI